MRENSFLKFCQGYLQNHFNLLAEFPHKDLEKVSEELLRAFKKQKTIFICGNGGSAATANHIVVDLMKCPLGRRGDKNIRTFNVISLSANSSMITAIANDISEDEIFAWQIKQYGKKDDVLIVISASGNSPNLLSATAMAIKKGMKTIGFLGFDGGRLKNMVDVYVHFEIDHYGIAEDFHLISLQLLCYYLAEVLEKEAKE